MTAISIQQTKYGREKKLSTPGGSVTESAHKLTIRVPLTQHIMRLRMKQVAIVSSGVSAMPQLVQKTYRQKARDMKTNENTITQFGERNQAESGIPDEVKSESLRISRKITMLRFNMNSSILTKHCMLSNCLFLCLRYFFRKQK